MHFLPLTLPDPVANVALDEALLDAADAGEIAGGVLRVWEPKRHFIVLGRSSRAEAELNWDACRTDGVAVLRRASGGATVVAGPGCLMYAVVLDAAHDPRLPAIDAAHRFVLGRLAASLAAVAPGIAHSGISDLTIPVADDPAGPRLKVSGNSLRCRRRTVLYHGTLLYDFDLALVSRWLCEPPRQPAYRAHRPHAAFIANLAATREQLQQAVFAAFDPPMLPLKSWPRARLIALEDRYTDPAWRVLNPA